MKIEILCVVISLLLHAAIIFIDIDTKVPEKKDPPPPPPKSERQTNNIRIQLIEKSIGGRSCKNSYVGIGVIHTFLSLEITGLVSGGPADRAGLRIGDEFVTDLNLRDLEPGTAVDIAVWRDGIMINKTIKVEKLCND